MKIKIPSVSSEIDSPDIKLFHSLLKMPLVKLPLTTSLITLSTGNILLSPHRALSAEEFLSMGTVSDIISAQVG